MSTPTRALRPQMAASRSRTAPIELISTADRGGITRETRRPWAVYLINGRVNPDARTAVANLIHEGWLYDTAPDALVSDILPTTKGLAKIGVTR